MDGLSWFASGQHESMPSLLLKAGFDVFLGNDRGTKNSQRHNELDPIEDAAKFYDFSYAELGLYDAPANLNFIRDQHAKGKPVTYIGYGQSSTAMLYALSKREKAPWFKQLLDSVVLLSPCVFLDEPSLMYPGMSEGVSMAGTLYKSYELVHDRYD